MRLLRMMLLALAVPLLATSACTAPSIGGNATATPAQASAAVERAAAAYYRAKPYVTFLADILPAPYAARVLEAQSIAERSITAARIATTAAEQLAELRKAEAAVKEIEAITGPG